MPQTYNRYDRYTPTLVGVRAMTRRGARGTIVGPAGDGDPARCSFQPDALDASAFTVAPVPPITASVAALRIYR